MTRPQKAFVLLAAAAFVALLALTYGFESNPEPPAQEPEGTTSPAKSNPPEGNTNQPGSSRPTDYVETVHGVSFTMKAIPGGTFLMGCGLEDEPCADDEWADRAAQQRQTTANVAPFYLAETEATWELYQTCIDAGACPDNDADGGDNGWGKGQRPVIEVSRDDVVNQFLPWLNQLTGRDYRLPSEMEWEYAARAGTTSRFSWGETADCSQARYGYVSGECGGRASTDPVMSFPPNGFGLYDMHGNVWEMVQDCWTEDDEATCVEFVLRGGSWLNAPVNLRSAARFHHDRSYRESGDGFRLAHDTTP
ncbi:MAG: formylglycine-generating enzyme family protein [Rhodothermales bacterium]|nr:formylglycine-generating enzyme family protein [Rhodothermales bacterium]MBO6778236.1 formylglycine-generating enzyme family protein [Rhodothermales bacterium]